MPYQYNKETSAFTEGVMGGVEVYYVHRSMINLQVRFHQPDSKTITTLIINNRELLNAAVDTLKHGGKIENAQLTLVVGINPADQGRVFSITYRGEHGYQFDMGLSNEQILWLVNLLNPKVFGENSQYMKMMDKLPEGIRNKLLYGSFFRKGNPS